MALHGDGATPAPSGPAPTRWAVVADVPGLVMVFLAVVTLGALLSGWFDMATLRSAVAAAGLLVGAAAVVTLVVLRTRPAGEPMTGTAVAALSIPAGGVLAGIVGLAVAGGTRQLEWFLNGDHTRHIVYVVDTWFEGGLQYTQGHEGYPRGLHAFLAAAWSTLGAGDEPAALIRLLTFTSIVSLVLSAMIALSTAHMTFSLGQRMGLGGWGGIAAGMVASALTLLNFAFANFQALGFETALLSALALTVSVREVLTRPGSPWSVIVTWSGVAVTAHSWQLVLPPMLVLALFSLHEWWVDRARCRAVVLSAVGAALVAVVVGVVAAVRLVGVGATSSVGPETPVPVALLVGGMACMLALASRAREARISVVAVACLLPAVTGAAVAALRGVGLFTYYPSKLIWHTALVCLPALVVAGALVVRDMGQRWSAPQAVGVVAVTMTGLIVAYGLLMPWGAYLGVWSTVAGDRVLVALRTPDAGRAQVVWLGSTGITDAVTRSLLDAYRGPRPIEKAPQAPLTVDEECRLLQAAPIPVVLSTESEADVRARYSCVGDIEVVPVRLPP